MTGVWAVPVKQMQEGALLEQPILQIFPDDGRRPHLICGEAQDTPGVGGGVGVGGQTLVIKIDE